MKIVHLAQWGGGDKSSNRQARGVRGLLAERERRDRDSSWILLNLTLFSPSKLLLTLSGLHLSRNEIFMEALDFICRLSSCQPPALLLRVWSLLRQQWGHRGSLHHYRHYQHLHCKFTLFIWGVPAWMQGRSQDPAALPFLPSTHTGRQEEEEQNG